MVNVLERAIHDLDRDEAQTVVDEVGRHVREHDESRSQPQPPDHAFHPRSPLTALIAGIELRRFWRKRPPYRIDFIETVRIFRPVPTFPPTSLRPTHKIGRQLTHYI
jgi:hypothetical protein